MKDFITPMVVANDLSAKSPQGWQAVQSADFMLYPGECVAVIGPNGSGKSSLLKCLSAEYSPTQGQIFLEGVSLESLSVHELAKKVAVVSQHEYFDPRLTVREYVDLGRIPHTFCCSAATHKMAVESALDDVGLLEKANRKMGVLSGGEQQRANIARALAQQPQLLLLDEPTNHLDPLARIEILDLIKRKGITAIAVLHDLPLVAPFADKVILMSEQRMTVCGPTTDVLTNTYIKPIFGLNVLTFTHPYTRETVYHFEASCDPLHHLSKGAA